MCTTSWIKLHSLLFIVHQSYLASVIENHALIKCRSVGEQIPVGCRIDNHRRLCWRLLRNCSHIAPVPEYRAVRYALSECKRISVVCQVDSFDAGISVRRDLVLFAGWMVIDQGRFVIALTLDTLSLVLDTLPLILQLDHDFLFLASLPESVRVFVISRYEYTFCLRHNSRSSSRVRLSSGRSSNGIGLGLLGMRQEVCRSSVGVSIALECPHRKLTA